MKRNSMAAIAVFGAAALTGPFLCAATLLAVLLGVAAPRSAGQRFFDDFSPPNDARRLDNAKSNHARGALVLSARHPEAVLAGTAVHPENLRRFTATIRFRFGNTGDPVLIVAWGKLREWDPLPESKFHCFLRRDGHGTFKMGKQTIGHVQLPNPEDGVHALHFQQDTKQISVNGDHGKVVLRLPEGVEWAGGYFSLKQQGLGRTPGEQPLRILTKAARPGGTNRGASGRASFHA